MLLNVGPQKAPISLWLQPALQLTAIILLFVAFLCPNPFSDSGVSLLVVAPYNVSSASASNPAASTIVFGGPTSNVTTAVPTSTSRTSSATSTSTGRTTPTASSPSSNETSSTTDDGVSDASSGGRTSTPRNSTSDVSLDERQYTLPPLTHNEVISNTSIIFTSPQIYSGQQLSSLELKYGPLGACFRDAAGARTCTPASLDPSLSSLNARLAVIGQRPTSINITGLPSTIRVTPILLLVTFISLVIIFLLSLPQLLPRLFPVSTKFAAYLSPESPVQQHLAKIVGLTFYARLGVAGLLLGAGISLRLLVSKAVYAFNAANASNTLPSSLTLIDSDDIGMQAVVGDAFSLLWASAILIFIEAYLERRRIRTEAAVAQARKDIESQYGRGVFEMMDNNRSKEAMSVKAESIYRGVAPSIKPARSVYGGSELSYTTNSRGVRQPMTVHRIPSSRSAASQFYHQSIYPAAEKEMHYANLPAPHKAAYLHRSPSLQEWPDEGEGYRGVDEPFHGPGWSETRLTQPLSHSRSNSISYPHRSKSRSRSRATSPTPSYWTSSHDIDERTLRTVPSRVDHHHHRHRSLDLDQDDGSEIDPERDLPPRGPSALSSHSGYDARSFTASRKAAGTFSNAITAGVNPLSALKRKASAASQRVREHHHVDDDDGDEEGEEKQEDAMERRRRECELDELAALEREILQRRRKELEWQMGRDQERSNHVYREGEREREREEGRGPVVGLGRLRYVKAGSEGGR